MKKITLEKILLSIITILILTLLITSIANAQDTNSSEFTFEDLEKIELNLSLDRNPGELGEKQIWLYKNETAPWDGVLLNHEAIAVVLSDKLVLQKKAELSLETQREVDLAKLNLETNKLKLEIENLVKKHNVLLDGRDEEIKSCQKINTKIIADRNHIKKKIFLGLGTGTAGLVIGVLVGLFIL